jgi:hypothetical protein
MLEEEEMHIMQVVVVVAMGGVEELEELVIMVFVLILLHPLVPVADQDLLRVHLLPHVYLWVVAAVQEK